MLSDKLHSPVGDGEMVRIQETAQFLAHSSIGNDMNLAQRTRLAAQLTQRTYPAGRNVMDWAPESAEMYIVRKGTLEVWSDPDGPGEWSHEPVKATTIMPGDMVGELTMLDQGLRTADLIAGPEGVTLLQLERDRLLALCEDDPELGSQLLFNIATVMSQRVRFILWQLQRARLRILAESRRRQSAPPET